MGCEGGSGQNGMVVCSIARETATGCKMFLSQGTLNETICTFEGDKVRWVHTHPIRGMFIQLVLVGFIRQLKT